MAVGAIELLKLPCSLSTGEYPLLSSAGQTLSSYTVATHTVRFTMDYQQAIRVPYVEGYQMINAARMGGLMWWVTDIRSVSDTQQQMTVHLTLNGPSSLLHKSDSISGEWSRLPRNSCAWLPRTPRSAAMQVSRTMPLPRLPTKIASTGYSIYWVQITSSDRISDAGTDHDSLTRYGFFAQVDEAMTSAGTGLADSDTSKIRVFPDLLTLINSPDEYGFTASAILDISISSRCPYQWSQDSTDDTKYKIVGADNAIQSLKTTDYFEYIIYEIEKAPSTFKALTSSLSVSLSSLERQCGSVTLRNENGSVLAVIDPSLSVSSVKVRCVSDYGSLITQVDINGAIYTIGEGHVPWIGNAWDEYRKYSLAYDREAMENSIDYANQKLSVTIAQNAASTVQSAALGAIGGGVGAVSGAIGGAASFGISRWASLRENEISQSEARTSQELAERRVQGQAGTAYNTGYGLIYAYQTITQPASIQVDMPAGLTSTIDTDYTARHGYPAEGPRTESIQAGYYRGRIFASSTFTGIILDRCNEAMGSGMIFKEV